MANYEDLRALAHRHGQAHIFRWWDELDDAQRRQLLEQVAKIDFSLLDKLVRELVLGDGWRQHYEDLRPADPVPLPTTPQQLAERQEAKARGEALLSEGRVAALVVAGGLGTRLGYPHPKGMFPASPVRNKSLFQLHAEKILAARRRYGAPIPWYVTTSKATDRETRDYFAANKYFGLPAEDVFFFEQGWLPAVDFEGRLLMAEKWRVAASPNGHGGVVEALARGGALDDMRRRGITTISYFQVDNPLVKAVDPVFLGYHAMRGSEFSSKALPKRDPEEGLGVFCHSGERMVIVEYSDLPRELKYARKDDGTLVYSAGSIAIHAIEVSFLERLAAEGIELPHHRAIKKVEHIDAQGKRVRPAEPNGIRFERFVFDVLPHARNPLVLMVERREEFAPIKRPQGEDSPQTARQAQSNLFGDWLERAGVEVPRDEAGNVAGPVEISPLFALDADELAQRLPPGLTFRPGLVLEP